MTSHHADEPHMLTDADRREIRRDIRALPPLSDEALSDEALDGLAAVILDAREQRAVAAHKRTTARHSTNESAA